MQSTGLIEELDVGFLSVKQAVERLVVTVREIPVRTELLEAFDFRLGHAELPRRIAFVGGLGRKDGCKKEDEEDKSFHKISDSTRREENRIARIDRSRKTVAVVYLWTKPQA